MPLSFLSCEYIVHFQRNKLSRARAADQAASSSARSALSCFCFGRVVGLFRPKALFVGRFVEFLDGVPVIGGHARVEDVAIDLAALLAPVLVALFLDEVEHLGEQRRLLGAQHVGHCQVGGVQWVELGREQLGIEFHFLLGRQLLGDLLDQPVDVFLARAGGKDRRELLLQFGGQPVDVRLRPPARAVDRPSASGRPTRR